MEINKAKRNMAFFLMKFLSKRWTGRIFGLNQICIKTDELHDLFESHKSEIKVRLTRQEESAHPDKSASIR
jgi:hypothetical protein